MPELTFPPQNPIWPPQASGDPRITPYRVMRKGNAGESFLDICTRFGIGFDDLMEFNFGLKKGEPHYLEKINWFLKHKLGCRKTTPRGNFIFSGGETIYIPQRGISFDEVDVVGTATEGRLSRYVYYEENIVEPRDSEAPNSIAMQVSDAIKDWMIGKATGRKSSPPNRMVTESLSVDVPKSNVLTAINVRRTRDDIKPSQFERVGSYHLKVEMDFVYGPGTPDQKVFVSTHTVWTEPNGNVNRISDSQYINQPSQYQDPD